MQPPTLRVGAILGVFAVWLPSENNRPTVSSVGKGQLRKEGIKGWLNDDHYLILSCYACIQTRAEPEDVC